MHCELPYSSFDFALHMSPKKMDYVLAEMSYYIRKNDALQRRPDLFFDEWAKAHQNLRSLESCLLSLVGSKSLRYFLFESTFYEITDVTNAEETEFEGIDDPALRFKVKLKPGMSTTKKCDQTNVAWKNDVTNIVMPWLLKDRDSSGTVIQGVKEERQILNYRQDFEKEESEFQKEDCEFRDKCKQLDMYTLAKMRAAAKRTVEASASGSSKEWAANDDELTRRVSEALFHRGGSDELSRQVAEVQLYIAEEFILTTFSNPKDFIVDSPAYWKSKISQRDVAIVTYLDSIRLEVAQLVTISMFLESPFFYLLDQIYRVAPSSTADSGNELGGHPTSQSLQRTVNHRSHGGRTRSARKRLNNVHAALPAFRVQRDPSWCPAVRRYHRVRRDKVLPDVRKLFGSEHLHILLIDCSDHFARVLCDELSPLPVDVKHMGSLSDSKEDKSESSSIDVNDDGGRYEEKNDEKSALSALMSESDGRMRSLLSSRQWEEWSGVCRAVIVDESTLKMKGFDLEEVLDKLVVLFPRLLLLTTTATTGILVERRMRKPELREAFLSLVRITFAKDINLRKPVVREALLTLVPMVCAKGIHVAVVDTVILVQVNETSSAQMVTTSETSLPISAELIGRRFLFGLIFSGGDVGKHILTFIPGKKGKEWEDGNEAACSGHLHLVKWLWEKGIRSDHRGAESAARNGHLVTLKWLHKQDIWCTTRGADDAAVYGDLVILKWLDSKT